MRSHRPLGSYKNQSSSVPLTFQEPSREAHRQTTLVMYRFLVLLLCLTATSAQEVHPAPEPYSFSYGAVNDDGVTGNTRQETGDASGRVTGFYTLIGEDGQQRRVDYVADENGFRATITTNEIGTESKNPADAEYLSSAPTAAQLAAQWTGQTGQQGVKRVTQSRVQTIKRVQSLGGGSVLRGAGDGAIVGGAVGSGVISGGIGSGGGVLTDGAIGGGRLQKTFVRTQSLAGQTGGGIVYGLPGSGRVETVHTSGVTGTGLGVAPVGRVSRVQTVRTSEGVGLGGVRVGVLPVGRVETVRTQDLGGVGVVGVSPVRTSQVVKTIRRQQLVPAVRTRTVTTGGVSRVVPAGGVVAGRRVITGAQPIGVSRVVTHQADVQPIAVSHQQVGVQPLDVTQYQAVQEDGLVDVGVGPVTGQVVETVHTVQGGSGLSSQQAGGFGYRTSSSRSGVIGARDSIKLATDDQQLFIHPQELIN